MQKSLRSELETLISPEAEKVLITYTEAMNEVLSMEINTVLLCGLTFSAEMQKRLDASTPEHKAFLKEFIQ